LSAGYSNVKHLSTYVVSKIGAGTRVALAKVFVFFAGKPRINKGQYHNQVVTTVFKFHANMPFF